MVNNHGKKERIVKKNQQMLKEGRNCWKAGPADRVSFLIDAQAYFDAFYKTINNARESIYIACWDIDSRTVLRHEENEAGKKITLGEALNSVVTRRRGLHVHILAWDYAMIFAFDREIQPIFNLGWHSHKRIHFHMNDHHPIGGCQHQKIVVVDNRTAFIGGIDVTKRRWDTSEHAPEDMRRIDPLGRSYGPVHDVQMLADGEIARWAGQLFRKQWRDATGRTLKRKKNGHDDPWPVDIAVDMTGVRAGIARTVPAYKAKSEIREAERLYIDAITAAQKYIYIENQYLTAVKIADVLAKRLTEKNGPEIIIILPYRCSGWLEESTMGALRAGVLKKLVAADSHKRLRVYYPVNGRSPERHVHVHAKVLIVDDKLVRVGSSNLSNRSMGLDTECDLACESEGTKAAEEKIALFRNRLLSEHLGIKTEAFAKAIARQGSLIKAVEACAGNQDRTLQPLYAKASEWVETIAPDPSLIDPEQPIETEPFIREIAPNETTTNGFAIKTLLVLISTVLISLALLWQFLIYKGAFNPNILLQWAARIPDMSSAPLFVMAAFTIGVIIMIPVTVLIAATVLLFEPVQGFSYALTGCLISAAVTYGLGNRLGRHVMRRIAGTKVNRISRRLSKRGVLTIVIARNIPLVHYSLANMLAGASRIRFRDFIIGTALGMTPLIFALTLFSDGIKKAFHDPQPANIITVIIVAIVIGLTVRWLKIRFP